jgi:hypothetical protein
MRSMVFLRAMNVGAANQRRPANPRRQLKQFGVVNIGACRAQICQQSTLRAVIAKKLSFKCPILAHDRVAGVQYIARSEPKARR